MNGKPSYSLLTLGAAVLALAGCGGGKAATNSTSFTIGGTIIGLTASSVVLVNDSATVTVSAGATSWVFPSSFPSTSSFSVSVLTQPAGELCEVTGGSTGTTLTANVTDVTVVCSVYGQWTWEAGLNSVNASGVYGTRSAASASNQPGARYESSSGTDSSGNLWLFGGAGYDSTGTLGNLNDLWQYSPGTGLWTWISGGNAANASGVYGTQGTASAADVPGARYSASSWTDSSGNLWLFGGYGYDATGALGRLDDLWEYSPGTGLWTWISGSNAVNATGVYGTQGTASAANVPGARYSASSWTDSSGNLWLFGGYGYDASGVLGRLDDLWKYSPGTGLWTWVSGGNAANASGVYGTQGTASASTFPGGRQAASAWADSSGNLWLFGGYGFDSTGALGDLNDLWQFTPNSGQWTWISGSTADNAGGVYGTQGTSSATNLPGARQAASSWIDAAGHLWLFGGSGFASTGGAGYLSDLWQYSPGSGQWTWISGAQVADVSGAYGIQGAISANTAPGARQAANSWIDASGHLWLFGGVGLAATGNGYLNDLWQFVPP